MVGPLLGFHEERDGHIQPGDDIATLREFQRIAPCATPGVEYPRPRGNPVLGEEHGDTRTVVGDRAGDE
jgi:hypothetical protein